MKKYAIGFDIGGTKCAVVYGSDDEKIEINDKIKLFDENKKSTQDYKEIEFKHDTINRYREKLKKI